MTKKATSAPEKKGLFGRKKDPLLAPIFIRIGATMIDLFILAVSYGIVVFVITHDVTDLLGRFGASVGNIMYDLLIGMSLLALYFIIVPFVWRGRTVGKRMFNIRIKKQEGDKVDFQTLVIRFVSNIGLNVAFLGIPAILNVYIVWWRKDSRAIHDMLARTQVVYEKRS
jgi:uncharacterized RDD family membrane protein YckC